MGATPPVELFSVVVTRTSGRYLLAAAVAGAAVLAVGCGDDQGAAIQSGPAPTGRDALPSLRRQAGELLGGGEQAFRARMAGLRGHPVVVNQWASWCGPCRYEFPFFARLARRYEGRVAFLGVNSKDNTDAARSFIKRYPVPFPHFSDPDGKIARVFRGGRAFPTTAYYATNGTLAYTHVGAYANEANLDADIRRYALHG
jgi:thiol-disulfide isomerase/thioredoxin